MKWDCESFASQYSNIYNRPTLIKGELAYTFLFQPLNSDANSRLSRKNLKRMERLERESAVTAPELIDEEMEEGSDDEVSTVSTFRPKGETPEQRKLRKQAVKEARRVRRVEKKANKEAFAEEYRKVRWSAKNLSVSFFRLSRPVLVRLKELLSPKCYFFLLFCC